MSLKERISQKIAILALALVALAIYQELRKPPGDRNWRGRLFGFVPYDFSVPTLDRIRDSFWNPSDECVLTDRVLGIGWGINFHKIYRTVASALSR